MAKRWVRRTLPISGISYGHSPDKRGERTDRWGREPIHVKRGWLGGYRVQDGNDRLYYARERGDSHIEAYVEVEDNKPAEPVKKRGWLYWE